MSAEIEKKDIVTDEQAKEAANKAYELMVVD